MTNTISPDGGFKSQIVGYIGGRVVRDEGTLLSKDGALIYTETKCSETNATVPAMVIGRIIRLDDHELVARWGSLSNDIVARKVE